MSSIPLSEQLGAMAFVNELRHQQKQIQEHLDLPRRRAEIAERIRAYYESNNLDFDEDLIHQGVRQFFAQRLMFEVPPLKHFDAWLVKALPNRHLLPGYARKLFPLRWMIVGALVVGTITMVRSCNSTIHYKQKVFEVNNAAGYLRRDRDELYRTLEVQRKALRTLQRLNAEQADANVSRLLQRAEQVMPAGDVRTDIGSAEPITRDNVDALEPQVTALEEEKLKISRAMHNAETDMGYAKGILSIRQKVREILQDPKRAAAIAQSSNLDERLAELDQQLNAVDDYDSFQDALATSLELSRDLFGDKDLLELQRQRYYSLKSRVDSKSVPDEMREQLQASIHEIEVDLKSGDSDAAEKKINQVVKRIKTAGYWSRY